MARNSDAFEDGGALQIGPTDQGMVRLIVHIGGRTYDLDYTADEAREISDEILASADVVERGGRRQPPHSQGAQKQDPKSQEPKGAGRHNGARNRGPNGGSSDREGRVRGRRR